MNLKTLLISVAQSKPFMVPPDGPQPKLNTTRITETVIASTIAAVIGAGIAMYVAIALTKHDIEAMMKMLAEIRQDVKVTAREQSRRTPMINWTERQMNKDK